MVFKYGWFRWVLLFLETYFTAMHLIWLLLFTNTKGLRMLAVCQNSDIVCVFCTRIAVFNQVFMSNGSCGPNVWSVRAVLVTPSILTMKVGDVFVKVSDALRKLAVYIITRCLLRWVLCADVCAVENAVCPVLVCSWSTSVLRTVVQFHVMWFVFLMCRPAVRHRKFCLCVRVLFDTSGF